jgi:hypothetical protein
VNDDYREPMYAQEVHRPIEPKPPRRRRPRWVGFVMVMAFVGTVLGVLVVLGLKYADGPAVGDIHTLATPTPSPSVVPGQTMQLLDGTYYSLKYPSVFDTVAHKPDDHIFADQYNISSQRDYHRLLTVSVHHFDYSYDEDSDYRSRLIKGYQTFKSQSAGEEVYEMVNPGGGERTIFWPHKGWMLELSVTSTSSRDDLADMIAKIKPTIRWKQ